MFLFKIFRTYFLKNINQNSYTFSLPQVQKKKKQTPQIFEIFDTKKKKKDKKAHSHTLATFSVPFIVSFAIMCCIPIYFSTTLKKGLDEWTQANSSKTYLKDSVHPAQGSVIQYLVYEHVYFARYSHFLALPIAWTSRSQPSSILEFR